MPIVWFEPDNGELRTWRQTGSSYRLAALPKPDPKREDHTFEGWYFMDNNRMYTVKVTTTTVFPARDTIVYANWSPYGSKKYLVTFNPGANGSLTATADGRPIDSGDSLSNGMNVVFTAEPIEGYRVVRWTVNNSVITDTSRTYTVAALSGGMSVMATFDRNVDVSSSEHAIPGAGSGVGVASVAPVSALSAELAAGPNPALKSSGEMSFFRAGKRVGKASLYIYDVTGNMVRKIYVTDDKPVGKGSRKIAVWDLRDASGRLVSDGTYLVKGVFVVNGKRELVSLVVGVR